MKIIDSHLHFSKIASFKHCADYESGVDYSYDGYLRESANAGITASVCMGVTETNKSLFPSADAASPMPGDLSVKLPEGMYYCPGINPNTLNAESLEILENNVKASKNVVGIKIYAGYYHIDIYDKLFEPVYRLADNYGVPVAIHSGDTYSDRGLLAYSHPLHVDRVAVAHPDLKVVICHVGNPWVMDACEVAYKNRNVFVDISGLYCGSAEYIRGMAGKMSQTDRFVQAFEYLNNYKKVLFGTDWPLAPFEAYIEFCKGLISDESHDDVFYGNALKVYNRIIVK